MQRFALPDPLLKKSSDDREPPHKIQNHHSRLDMIMHFKNLHKEDEPEEQKAPVDSFIPKNCFRVPVSCTANNKLCTERSSTHNCFMEYPSGEGC
ncbi:hypothetical protein C4D60_Mb03t21900 [Musa balbisiana]|uniref:Uncharacterized protein n=1 Tax=Musa balbisiana TaxID=52838 RepID=A0A4S8JDE3_MUSBA|nr:hypothetical protein C4D60_Mb03t21900 [Musa balbisiana]